MKAGGSSGFLESALERMQHRDFPAAEVLLDKVLKSDPSNPRALCLRAIAAAESGRRMTAEKFIAKAMKVAPDMPAVINNAATLAAKFGDEAKAERLWARLVRVAPDFAQAHFNLAIAHRRKGDLDAAVESQRKGVALDPSNRWGHSNLGNLLKDGGRAEEAVAVFAEGAKRNPGDLDLQCNLCYAAHFDPAYGKEEIFRLLSGVAARFTGKAGGHANDRTPGRSLRVGFVAPTFRDHSESYFVLPLFRGLDRGMFEIVVYSTGAEDSVTPLFQQHAAVWHAVPHAGDDELSRLIREDGIDILVDLTQHMAGQRLELFARKPAPVQVIWLAYPSTSGMTQMDYRITDPFLETGGDEFNSERSKTLASCYWCYEVIGPKPDAGGLPMAEEGHVTFGCLNNYGKVTRRMLAVWREILTRVPGSRLVLFVNFRSVEEDVRKFFEEAGIGRERILCQGRMEREAYLESYRTIDIALDCFPYNGATTTCDALWMGVPVISRAGETPVSRAGLSVLSNVGLERFVALTDEEYVSKAVALAGDMAQLTDLRGSLRERLERSPVMDAANFGKEMGGAFRSMWEEWCASGA